MHVHRVSGRVLSGLRQLLHAKIATLESSAVHMAPLQEIIAQIVQVVNIKILQALLHANHVEKASTVLLIF